MSQNIISPFSARYHRFGLSTTENDNKQFKDDLWEGAFDWVKLGEPVDARHQKKRVKRGTNNSFSHHIITSQSTKDDSYGGQSKEITCINAMSLPPKQQRDYIMYCIYFR